MHDADIDIEDLIAIDPSPIARVARSATVAASSSSLRHGTDTPAQVPGTQSVYMRTFGCSHNMSDSEYMAGILQEYGYKVTSDESLAPQADVWLVNSCTVKGPSQAAVGNLVSNAKKQGIPVVVSGCVPQGDRHAKELDKTSLLGVSQIDRVVEAVEETLKGNTVQLLSRKTLPRLDLPKVRRNKHVEIVPLSQGCLGACTYCKTKHARGHLGSYAPEALLDVVKNAVADPQVREIWLSSEDTGAYGRDIGASLPSLLQSMLALLPSDGRCMLRIGMTNPPYMLEHLEGIAAALRHPACFAYLHIPVQSGSNVVLEKMNREYTIEEFERCCDTLLQAVPELELATDIIAGFPGESEEDHSATLRMLQKYRFPHTHISQFYPRPGTPAARMKRIPTHIVKQRSREITALVETWEDAHTALVGTLQRCTVVDVAADKTSRVAHTKNYVQILLPEQAPDGSGDIMGCVVDVNCLSASRWSVKGEVVRVVYRPPAAAGHRQASDRSDVIPPVSSPSATNTRVSDGMATSSCSADPFPAGSASPHAVPSTPVTDGAAAGETPPATSPPSEAVSAKSRFESEEEEKERRYVRTPVAAPLNRIINAATPNTVFMTPEASSREALLEEDFVTHGGPASDTGGVVDAALHAMLWVGVLIGLFAVFLSGVVAILK